MPPKAKKVRQSEVKESKKRSQPPPSEPEGNLQLHEVTTKNLFELARLLVFDAPSDDGSERYEEQGDKILSLVGRPKKRKPFSYDDIDMLASAVLREGDDYFYDVAEADTRFTLMLYLLYNCDLISLTEKKSKESGGRWTYELKAVDGDDDSVVKCIGLGHDGMKEVTTALCLLHLLICN
jgi:hypothetical protein